MTFPCYKERSDINIEKQIKILHLEDLPSDALLIAKALKKGAIDYDGLVVDTRAKFITALKDFFPDIILADHSLPSFNSVEALELFQETGMEIPFILVSAAMSDEFAVGMLKRGADDYILKDRLHRLPSAIQNCLEKLRLQKERRIYLDELVNSERRFRVLVENSADGIVILNAEGKTTYASPSASRLLGYTEEEILHIGLADTHPGDKLSMAILMEQVMANPGISVKGHTGRILHKDGSWRWMEATITNLLHDPAINGIVDIFRDITESKLAAQKIEYANRLYAFISQINQTIAHSRDEQTVFKNTCRIAIEYGKFKAAWIGILDVPNKKINIAASSGILNRDIDRFTNASYEDKSPRNYVLQNDNYYVCNDIQNNLELNKWKQFATDAGINSTIVFPIKKSGMTIGTFNLYAAEVDFFSSAEIALLGEATGDISFALDVFEREKRKQEIDEKLADSELSLKQAQSIAQLGSWELNFATGISVWSEENLRIHGLSVKDKEQTFTTWSAFIHPQDRENTLKIISETKSSLSNADFFYRIVRKDNSVRYLHAQVRVKFNNEGKPIGLHGVVQDVTETKIAELALRESESNLQTIFENTSEGFILTDITGIVKSFNNKSKEIIYLNTEQEIRLGASIFDYVHPSRKDDYKNSIETVLTGKTLKYDYPYTRKNGEIKWFDFSVNPVYANGNITGLCVTSADITERKQGEELLRRSESNLNAIIENTDAFIYSVDRDLKYITYNTAMVKMMKDTYGITITPGYHVFDFLREVDPGSIPEWNDVYSKALTGEIVKFEKEFIVDDFYSYSSVAIHPIWENKKVIGLSCFVHDITREKKAEAETRFKANLLNTIGQAAIATDMDGTINYWNKAAEVIYGWTREEAMNKNIVDLIPSPQTKEQGILIMEQLGQGHSWSGEFIVQRKDGTPFPVFVTDSPIYDQNDKLTGIIGISSDITEKKNLENLLEKTSQLARIGSWEIDTAKETIFWSSITKLIHGVGEDFIPDLKTAIGFYKAGYSKETITMAVNDAIKKGSPFDLELQIVNPKGLECWVRANGQAEFAYGKCVRLYGSLQDIDKTKKAEIEILKVYDEKNTILESIGDAFFAVDKNWVVTYWNNQAEKMLQTSKDSMLGRNLWDVFSGSIDSVSYQNYHRAIQTRELICFKDYFDPLNKWFEINAYPSDNGLSVFFKDITEQKKSEDEREKMTADIIQRNAALEQFSYIISHNLRAPVANIIGLSSTLQKNALNNILKEKVLNGLSSSVLRLDEVIKDLNTILKVKQELNEHKQVVNFAQLTQDIRLSIGSIVTETKALITWDFSEVGEMLTIKSYLHSIFYNLISNSLKYRQTDIPPVIEIKSQWLNDKVVLLFKDNGMGIDLQKIGNEVFGLYKRFHANQAEGKGMGLYMVKTQVESLEGKISLTSEVNKGTSFRIEFQN